MRLPCKGMVTGSASDGPTPPFIDARPTVVGRLVLTFRTPAVHGRTGNAGGAGQRDLGPQHQTVRQGSGAGETLPFRFLALAEHDWSHGATECHGHTSRQQRLPIDISFNYGT